VNESPVFYSQISILINRHTKMKNSLNWRYATKQYDSTKKLSDEQVNDVIEAINSAPTGYGLQPFKVIRVKSEDLRVKLREAAYGQPQVTDASDFLILAALKKINHEVIDNYMNRIVEVRGVEKGMLDGFVSTISGTVGQLETATAWSAKQAYIGLGFGLAMAAHLKIDSSPMEGFSGEKFDEILGLTDYTSVVLLALGHRSEEDKTQHNKKVRKSIEQFVDVR